MKQTDMNILTKKKYYPIYSSITGRLYMDESGRCYLFEAEQYAKMFCQQVPGCTYRSADYIKPAQFCTTCNTIGINKVCIKQSMSKGFAELDVLPTDGKKQHYNTKVMRSLLLLKSTKKKKYLRELKTASFVAPLILKERKVKEYPVVRYATATIYGQTFFPVFTTMQEYERWQNKAKVPFLPHEISMTDLMDVRKNNSIIVNMASDRIILTNSMLHMT